MIFREICDSKIGWDTELPDEIRKKWEKWEQNLPSRVPFPRAFHLLQETISLIEVHVFGDASFLGICAAAYVIIHQPSGVKQGLIASKSRVAKKGLTIPRLEPVAAQTSANLAVNIKNAFQDRNVILYGWSDSTTVLHWIQGQGSYKQFVENRVRHIKSKGLSQWNYVSSAENPADLGSRGCNMTKLDSSWCYGPEWLKNVNKWPEQTEINATPDSTKEERIVREYALNTTEKQTNNIMKLVEEHSFVKSIRVIAWIKRFIHNCRMKNPKEGPIMSEELETVTKILIRLDQQQFKTEERFQLDKKTLNLQENKEGILQCHGRIQGEFPTYLPGNSLLSRKITENAHRKTMNGGVAMTMSDVREKYWIPKLRQLAKTIIRQCPICQKFQSRPYETPPPGFLPEDRTTIGRPFEIIGIDFAGPIYYKSKTSKENKSYLLLISCSLTRAIHLELQPSQNVSDLIMSLKRFIARRGCPKVIYLDNAKTFKAASKWIKTLLRSEELITFLNDREIKWKFNLSRAPWWGGQFERLIGLTKESLYKTIGRSNLTFKELEEVLLDIEATINNRPLCYQEDDIQYPTLTPNVMIHGYPTFVPVADPASITEQHLRKRQRYVERCKQALWKRWEREYLRALRERHNMNSKQKKKEPCISDVVLIKEENKNKGKWDVGVIDQIFEGRDGNVRAVRMKTSKSFLERAVQHLYPLELNSDHEIFTQDQTQEADIGDFIVEQSSDDVDVSSQSNVTKCNGSKRSKRDASVAAKLRIRDIADDDSNTI